MGKLPAPPPSWSFNCSLLKSEVFGRCVAQKNTVCLEPQFLKDLSNGFNFAFLPEASPYRFI